MITHKKTFHEYPKNNREPEIYVPSFFLEIPFDKQILKAEIRPLTKDKGYFTVSINHIFLAHIHKVGSEWTDFIGGKNEVYQAVGIKIDEYINNGNL
jgi:hypothetical protein